MMGIETLVRNRSLDACPRYGALGDGAGGRQTPFPESDPLPGYEAGERARARSRHYW